MTGYLVKCVRRAPQNGYGDERQPEVGKIYRVRQEGPRTIRLAEIKNPRREYRTIGGLAWVGEIGFLKTDFERVDPHQIDVFRALLQPLPNRAGRPA